MKKIISAALAGALALSLSVPSFAKGGVFEPTAGETNTITIDNGSNDPLAKITFRADSDPDRVYVGMTTSWSDLDVNRFESLFDNQDAYLFGFVINPSIPAASIPTVLLYSPFVDDDGEPTVSKVYIYSISKDGKRLTDVTSSFSKTSADDKPVYAINTRLPGVYVITDQQVKTGDAVAGSTEKETSTAKKKSTEKSNSTGIYLPSSKK